jgi:hypothetical protein
MPNTPSQQRKKKHSSKKGSRKQQMQKAGSSDVCQKDINQLLMGNPPVSIGSVDISSTMKDTVRTAKELDKYAKTGWGNYPGTPPKPDCVIL